MMSKQIMRIRTQGAPGTLGDEDEALETPQPEQSSLEGQIQETTENTTKECGQKTRPNKVETLEILIESDMHTADQILFGGRIYTRRAVSVLGRARRAASAREKNVRRAASTNVMPAELRRYRKIIVKVPAELRRHATEDLQSCISRENITKSARKAASARDRRPAELRRPGDK
ncbi:hypothetical protein B0H16DRAFT_1455242 [Mycena metata]|uniref:Uncharacterized protein n=1 Tax=Mycena metata TaxID=1033252 RepID=A0AAD7JHB2_9AGAR|nr:hypothetical protein B0H16DRAFT_1455242 [Mycena metata]